MSHVIIIGEFMSEHATKGVARREIHEGLSVGNGQVQPHHACP